MTTLSPVSDGKWLEVSDVSKKLGVSAQTIYYWQKTKKIDAKNRGGKTVVDIDQVRDIAKQSNRGSLRESVQRYENPFDKNGQPVNVLAAPQKPLFPQPVTTPVPATPNAPADIPNAIPVTSKATPTPTTQPDRLDLARHKLQAKYEELTKRRESKLATIQELEDEVEMIDVELSELDDTRKHLDRIENLFSEEEN